MGCEGEKLFSVRVNDDQLTYGLLRGGGTYTANASSFMVYNNTNTIVTFNNVPYNPGGSACFDEQFRGVYDTPMQISFANPNHTGSFIVNKMTKFCIEK